MLIGYRQGLWNFKSPPDFEILSQFLIPELKVLELRLAAWGTPECGCDLCIGLSGPAVCGVTPPPGLAAALGVVPHEVFANVFNYMARLESAGAVRALTPNMTLISKIDRPGVIVTAPGDEGFDFVSRYFAPAKGIREDPVTGAAHCMLTPYWAEQLGKTEFRAYQASRRGGEIVCRLAGDRVELEGACGFSSKAKSNTEPWLVGDLVKFPIV